jgi:hypothetical protein
MSLINDALKKANQMPAPITPAQIKEPLQVAAHKPPARWPMFVVPPLVAIVFGAGTWLVVKGWDRTPRVSAKESASVASEKASPVDTDRLAPYPSTNAAVATTPPTNAPVVPKFPALKLQGLIWHPQRPSVVINGKSLFVGEKVEQARVMAITPDSVMVVWKGEQQVLTLR